MTKATMHETVVQCEARQFKVGDVVNIPPRDDGIDHGTSVEAVSRRKYEEHYAGMRGADLPDGPLYLVGSSDEFTSPDEYIFAEPELSPRKRAVRSTVVDDGRRLTERTDPPAWLATRLDRVREKQGDDPLDGEQSVHAAAGIEPPVPPLQGVRETYPVRTYWAHTLGNPRAMITTQTASPFKGVRVEVEQFADYDDVMAALDAIRETVGAEHHRASGIGAHGIPS